MAGIDGRVRDFYVRQLRDWNSSAGGFDRALVRFAERYADRNEHDYGLVVEAARSVRRGL